METALTLQVNQYGLSPETSLFIEQSFAPFFKQTEEWMEKAKGLEVTDISQVMEMQMAKQARLALKNIRVEADKTRKALKEDSLKYGNAVQQIYNIIEGRIKPIETELESKEKFAEIQEEKRKELLKSQRVEMLFPYEVDTTYMDLRNMSEPVFSKLLEDSKFAYDARIAAQLKAEQDKAQREKEEAEERERIRLENIKLREEAEKREKEQAELNAMIEAERKENERVQNEHRKAEEERIAAIEEKARKEREAAETERKRIQAELDAKKEEERKEAERKQAEERAKKEAEKKAAKAPDKEKLFAMLNAVTLPGSNVKTEEGINVDAVIREKFESFKKWSISVIETM